MTSTRPATNPTNGPAASTPAPRPDTARGGTAVRAGYGLCLAGGAAGVATLLAPSAAAGAVLLPVLGLVALQAVLVALIVRWMDRRHRLLRRGPVLVVAAWGALVATTGPAWATTGLEHLTAAVTGPQAAGVLADVLTAPVLEELGKALGVLAAALLVRGAVAAPAHGALLGMVSGLAFHVVENVLYAGRGALATGSVSGTLEAVGARLLVGLWGMHWMYGALGGIAVALLLGRTALPAARRHLAAAGAALLAVALHVLNNLGAVPAGGVLSVLGLIGGTGVVTVLAWATVVRPVLARAA